MQYAFKASNGRYRKDQPDIRDQVKRLTLEFWADDIDDEQLLALLRKKFSDACREGVPINPAWYGS